MSEPLKVGFLGAGYIAKWHADALKRTPGARLAGVCDLSASAAASLAGAYGVKTYASLDEMLAPGEVDCVHVLTPPSAHYENARQIIAAGKHAFVEKPFVLSSGKARDLAEAARAAGVRLGVNHNFLMLPGYERFKKDIADGVIGPIDAFNANWRFSLPPLRSGPYGLWMLREPKNILFELGPHLFAFVADLFSDFEVTDVALRYPVETPGGPTHYQGWRVSGLADETAVTLDLSLIEGHDDRSIEARGLGARARFSFAEDVYAREGAPFGDIVVGPLMAQMGRAASAAKAGVVNAARQFSSLNMLAPYGLSMTRACQSFYASLEAGAPVDLRLSADLACEVITMIERAAAIAAPRFDAAPAPARLKPVNAGAPADTLVIGGTGFIGRYLVDALVKEGRNVRVLSRGRAAIDGAETFTGDLKSEADLLAAMDGVKTVYHLARAEEKSWEAYLENDVAVTRRIGEACLKAGVERLVYTGTIDSYDASQPDRRITEETPFDENLEQRNLYARSKAECEKTLKALAAGKGLPLVIVRPGIVIGRGGPLQHWGIAMWRGATACKLWGEGANTMPFVSARDTAAGLVLAGAAPEAIGRSFNLVGDPMLSAQDYFAEIGRAYGVRMNIRPTPIWNYYLVDVAKYWAKRLLARKKGLTRPSYRDWKSRAQLSPYDNALAKELLGWTPQGDREAFIAETIAGANLFGVATKSASPAAMSGAAGVEDCDTLTRSA